MKKRILVVCMVLVICMVAVACTQNAADPADSASGEEATDPADSASGEEAIDPADSTSEAKKIAFISGLGGIGDKSFNELAYQGILSLEDQGIECDLAEPSEVTDFEAYLRTFSESGDYALIIAMGGDMSDACATVASEFPDQYFLNMDGSIGMDNVLAISINQSESGFMLGVMAGLAISNDELPNSQGKKKIGVVGGMDIPLINAIIAGYEAGARFIDPEIEVLIGYAGSFGDPGKGAELTQGLFDQGADIVFQAAGSTGLGVIEAAKNSDFYAIGYDGNQNLLAPDSVVASGVRGLDDLVEYYSLEALKGEYLGGQVVLSFSDNAKASRITFDGSNVVISDNIKEDIEKIKDMLINGAFVVPSALEDVDSTLEGIGTYE